MVITNRKEFFMKFTLYHHLQKPKSVIKGLDFCSPSTTNRL